MKMIPYSVYSDVTINTRHTPISNLRSVYCAATKWRETSITPENILIKVIQASVEPSSTYTLIGN